MKTSKNIADFNSLFNEHYHKFVRFSKSYIGDEQKSKDFVSDAFMCYWEKLAELPNDVNAPAYILTIVKNNCLNYLKHRKVKQKATNDLTNHRQWLLETQINTLEACNPDKIFSKEIQEIIENTISNLPSKTAQVFKMSRFESLAHKEIAAQLGISTKAVEYHITKALNQLRVSLRDFLTLTILFVFYF